MIYIIDKVISTLAKAAATTIIFLGIITIPLSLLDYKIMKIVFLTIGIILYIVCVIISYLGYNGLF